MAGDKSNTNKITKCKEVWDEEIARQNFLLECVDELVHKFVESLRFDLENEFKSYLEKYEFVCAAIHQEYATQDKLKAKIGDLKKEIDAFTVAEIYESYNVVNKFLKKKSNKLSEKISKKKKRMNKKEYQERVAKREELKKELCRLKKMAEELKLVKYELEEKDIILEQKRKRYELIKRRHDEAKSNMDNMLKKKEDMLNELKELEQLNASSSFDDSFDEDFF